MENLKDSNLISGSDALRALADGKEVEFKTRVSDWDLISKNDAYALALFLDSDTSFSFRIKPQTIKLELEMPKPFEPKDGERYFYLNPHADAGYGVNTTTKWNKYLQFGAWRTEDEIKQVVEQLRKIKGAV